MRIEVNNVAKISHANVEVNGIAVLAGPNGSGKSTVSRSLMAASSLALHLTKLTDISRAKSVLEVVGRFFSSLRIAFDVYRDLYYVEEQLWKPILAVDFWTDPAPFMEWCKKNFEHSLERPGLGYMSELSPSKVRAVKEQWGEFAGEIQRRLAAKESDHVRNAAENVIVRAFAGQVKPLGRRSVSGSIKLIDRETVLNVTIKAGEVNGCIMKGGLPVSSLFYIEPSNQLDMFSGGPRMGRGHYWDDIDRYTALEFCYFNVMSRDKLDPMTMEERKQWRLSCECLKKILEKIGGKLDKNSRQLFFRENCGEKDLPIDLRNMASGIKSIASICRAIEMNVLRENGLLIIDEPESNLHPDWQVAISEFLVSLYLERGIKILLNTHSPYMLRALRHFAKKQGSRDVCAFYQMLEGSDGFVTDLVTDRVDVLFQDLFAPFDAVMRD